MNAQFKELFEKLTALGYVEQSAREFTDYLNQEKVTDPHNRKKQGKQVPFRFALGTRSIVIWTTYSPEIDGPKEGYHGWAIILDAENQPVLFSFPVYETPSFFTILYKYAAAFKELLEKWPKCPQCGYELTITKGTLMHQRIFQCMAPSKLGRHKESRLGPAMEDLIFLSKDNYWFLRKKFLKSLNYQKNKAEGSTHRRIDRFNKRNAANAETEK